MAKKLLALVLCLVMLASTFVGCAKRDEDYKGAYINMYLTDMVYDLDPAHAYENESNLRVISLIFDNLFVLDEKGKVQKSLAKDYEMLGMLCFAEMQKGAFHDNEAFLRVADEIKAKTAQIEELKNEVLKAKNKKRCPKCNAAIDKGAAYCNACGEKLDED